MNEIPDTHRKALSIIEYTKRRDVDYNAFIFPSGYHSVQLEDRPYMGQRNNEWRLQHLSTILP